MSTFKESAARMAERLRLMKRLQQLHREMGDEEVLLPIQDLFSAGDQAALDAYERELNEHLGNRPLPFEQVAS